MALANIVQEPELAEFSETSIQSKAVRTVRLGKKLPRLTFLGTTLFRTFAPARLAERVERSERHAVKNSSTAHRCKIGLVKLCMKPGLRIYEIVN